MPEFDVGHGDVLISSITSCTNTSNPALLIAAGLLAKRAVEKGLKVSPRVKTSLAPGSKVVTDYLRDAGLLPYLEKLGYGVVAYGCTTCMGAAGPLDAKIEEAVVSKDLVTCAVLSGNRNFEARVHANLRANYLASPALVVAYGIAGTVRTDLTKDPLGTGSDGKPVYLKDVWPTDAEVAALLKFAANADHFRSEYGDLSGNKKLWEAIPTIEGAVYKWDAKSTFIKEPPFFEGVTRQLGQGHRRQGRARAGDPRRLDHHRSHQPVDQDQDRARRPANGSRATTARRREWGHFGVRRCNHELMVRGTFANVRLRNQVAPGTEGPITKHQPDGAQMTIFEASELYQASGTPLVIFGGDDYGMGSSRDWAAKGVQLLGVKAVIVKSFERIHRANLIGMGVLPLQFKPGDSVQSLKIDGTETFAHRRHQRRQREAAAGRFHDHHPRRRQHAERAAHAAHRHRHRGRLPQARRHPAVRAAPDPRRSRIIRNSHCINTVNTNGEPQCRTISSTRCRNSSSSPARPANTIRSPRWKKPASARPRACRSACAWCSNRCCATATASASPKTP